MKSNREDFTDLKRLLSLKRHEQPPPGYFERLSPSIIRQLERAAAEPAPWRRRLRAIFDPSPMLAGSCVAAVASLLIAGFAFSGDFDEHASAEALLGFASTESPLVSGEFESLYFEEAPAGELRYSAPETALSAASARIPQTSFGKAAFSGSFMILGSSSP